MINHNFRNELFPANVAFGAGLTGRLRDFADEIGPSRSMFATTAAGTERYSALLDLLGTRVVFVFDKVEPHCPEPVISPVIDQYKARDAIA